MYQKIEFMSRSNIMHKNPEADAVVISIASSNMENAHIKDGFKGVLFMKFDNNQHLSNHEIRFSRSHADEILNFVRQNESEAQTIYVNCIMGESRSAAVAQALADYYHIEMKQKTNLKVNWIYDVLGMQALRTHKSKPKLG